MLSVTSYQRRLLIHSSNCSAMKLRYHQLCSLWFHRINIETTWQVNTARFPVPRDRNIVYSSPGRYLNMVRRLRLYCQRDLPLFIRDGNGHNMPFVTRRSRCAYRLHNICATILLKKDTEQKLTIGLYQYTLRLLN